MSKRRRGSNRSLDGFAAMGKPIPEHRLSSGIKAVKDMVPEADTETAMLLVCQMAKYLEQDEPFKALHSARGVDEYGEGELHTQKYRRDPTMPKPRFFLDLTGAYRLMATLLAG